jgi:hypothetical protein
MVLRKKTLNLAGILLEVALLFLLLYFSLSIKDVIADVAEHNVTIITELDIGNTAPTIKSIDIEQGTINLIPNSTKIVNCSVIIEDFDTDVDIKNISAEFFDNSASFYGDNDDNNHHYTNKSCFINRTYGDINTAIANCIFQLEYYANPETWNCSVEVNDYSGYKEENSNTSDVQPLLALGLPSTINYGTVNATYVSNENITNVTNYGNVKINLSLSGYAENVGDGFAMNCSLGTANISIEYEKFNLTDSTPGSLSLSEFENSYINLTSSPIIKRFDLNYRQNDTHNKATNKTYWRIYVPKGIGGTCQGNIVFGAVQSPET